MGSQIIREAASVLLAIVTLAIIATLVSRNANTAGVTNSLSSAFNTGIATAAGPVTGYSPGAPIYANSNQVSPGFGSLSIGGVGQLGIA